MNEQLSKRTQEYRSFVENYLLDYYKQYRDQPQTQLFEAMEYSLMAGGKRLRPIFTLEFCRMCGADTVVASGHPCLSSYPLHTVIYAMQCPRDTLSETDACLFPVTEQTLAQWLQIYNQRMSGVDNSAYMDSRDGKEMLKSGDGYFIHRNGQLLGIGRASGDTVDAVIAVEQGMGQTVLSALSSVLLGEIVRLTVAGTNVRAMRLYERLGFMITGEISRWYLVFGN